MGETLQLSAADGHRLSAYLARPEGTPRGGLVVIQEIFGVNSHVRSVADGYAADGYLAVAPALFDRVERGCELGYGPDDVARGRELRGKVPGDAVMQDTAAAIAAARDGGKVGIIGYCWGGSVAWLAACRLGVTAAVGYYGGQIYDDRAERPTCPVMLHFGETDAHITMDHVAAIRDAHRDVEVFTYPAGHGFNCDHRADYHAESARLARGRSLDFLNRHLA